MPVIVATVGGGDSNSYETLTEANAYFDTRIPLNPPWIASGQEAVLIMSTRVLDALTRPFRTLFVDGCGCAYYRIRRQWTGAPATTTQRLAWPRVGMFDQNGNPLDIGIVSNSVANPTVITTESPHRLTTGETVLIFGVTGSTPDINGERVATVISPTTFSVPVNVTIAGVGGRVTWIPQELKDAESELAGQLLATDRTLDNDIFKLGLASIRAGSVALSFRGDLQLQNQVIPDAVYDLLPVGWLTPEIYEPAMPAEFDVVSD